MHVVLANNTKIPALKYGGTERVIWWLGKYLVRRGHRVTYLVARGSHSPFAEVREYRRDVPIEQQVPPGADILHVHFPLRTPPEIPHLVTVHGCGGRGEVFIPNTVFVSASHARDHSATCFVHNGLDIEDYAGIRPAAERRHLLFLARTTRREKNLRGAIALARTTGERLAIAGGWGFSFSPRVRYHGMAGGEKKLRLLDSAKALLFPILWSEPFGLAVIEAMYAGRPVFGTPYGALPEIVTPDTGVLSTDFDELAAGIRNFQDFSPERCRRRIVQHFTADVMTENYLEFYERILSGEQLHVTAPRTADLVHTREFRLD